MGTALAIEACAAWPIGRHMAGVVFDMTGGAQTWHVDATEGLADDDRVHAHFPRTLSDRIARGRLTKMANGEPAERIGRGIYLRQWLDLVRAAYPGVRWREGAMVRRKAYGKAVRAVYGYVGRKLVAAISEVRRKV